MMRRRRRPLRRAAMVGGVAYHAGKQPQQGRGEQAAPAAAPAAAQLPPVASRTPSMDQLKQLAELKDSGVLTQEEFDDQKRRILQGV